MFSLELLVEICIHKLIGFSLTLTYFEISILYFGCSFIEEPILGRFLAQS